MADPDPPLPAAPLPDAPHVVVPMCVLGSLGEFDPKTDNISSYLERLQLYFEANSVGDEWKVAVLLTVIGAKTYETLRSLLAPVLPREKSFVELLRVLKKHFDPQPLVIGERFHFYQRSQKTGESIADFVADLRRLSIKCEFGEFLYQALRDRFVCGVKSESLQKKLLTEADLTIKRAQEIGQSIESAERSARDLKVDTTPRMMEPESVNLATSTRTPVSREPCYRCGRRHDASFCKFKEATCHRCGKQGHIAPVCKTASPPPADRGSFRSYQQRQTGGTKWMVAEVEDNEALPLFVLRGDPPQPPILVTMSLNKAPVNLELDTGAAVTVMSEGEFRQWFPDQSLDRSPVQLKTYTGEPMMIIGATEVEVAYQDQESKTLSLVVVEGKGPSLLGRNWLQHFTLDWNSIKTVLLEKDALRQLLLEHEEVFSDELGTITPGKAKLAVSPSAVPRFHRPRPVPYALKPLVEQELDRLKRELRTRFNLLRPDREAEVARKQAQQKAGHDRHSAARQFAVGDLVMERNFRSGPDWVPATVVARLGPLSYLLESADKQLWRKHVDRVKARTVFPVSHSQPSSESESTWESVGSGPARPVEATMVSQPAGDSDLAAETLPEPEQLPQIASEEETATSSETLAATDGTTVETRRYPPRDRQAPNFYRPDV